MALKQLCGNNLLPYPAAKRVAGAPQFTALLSDWVARGKFKDSKFKFVAPKGAHKIEFLPAGN